MTPVKARRRIRMRVEAAGTIECLEVIESDVAKRLAEMRTWKSSRSRVPRCQKRKVDVVSHREAEVD